MSEPRPLASLTAGLLARKGQALPAVRPAFQPRPAADHRPPAVVVHQARLAAAFPAPAEAAARERRVALTLRLDDDRHLRLKLIAARRRTTIQSLLLDALDEMLTESNNDECVCGVGG